MTSVINCKVAHIRPAYKDLKEWMADSKNLYIARRGVVFVGGERWPKEDSPWANPFKIGKDGTREEVIRKYETYIRAKILSGAVSLAELEGKCLGCWCAPEPCHGHVLMRLLEEQHSPKTPE